MNDAPALRRADVGLAVHGATAAAQSSADIVLAQPGLSTVVHAVLVRSHALRSRRGGETTLHRPRGVG